MFKYTTILIHGCFSVFALEELSVATGEQVEALKKNKESLSKKIKALNKDLEKTNQKYVK